MFCRGKESPWVMQCVSPVCEMFQFKDVHSLSVARSTEELRVHAEHERADVHVPTARKARGLVIS